MIRFMRNHFIEMIVIVIAVSLLLGFWLCVCKSCSCFQCETVINAVAAFATLLNAILLFYTLKHQDRSFEQERFETTFFNLLDQRRKIVDAFSMSCSEWDYVSHGKVNKIYQGETCFQVAVQEVQWIRDNLFGHDSYSGILDDSTFETSIEMELGKIHSELNDDKMAIRKMDDDFRCRLINQTYQITYDFFNKQQRDRGDEHKEIKVSLTRFTWINGMFTEHYFRHLKQILKFLGKRQIDRKYYIEFLLSQMTQEEMVMVYYYSLTNDEYQNLLDKLGIFEKIKHLHNSKYYHKFKKYGQSYY